MGEDWFVRYFGADYLSIYRLADTQAQLTLLRRLLSPWAGGLVYDIPCGHGRHSVPLSAEGYRVVSADLSSVFLSVASRAGQEQSVPLRLVRADMRTLPFADGQGDVLISMFSSLGYFDDDAQHRAVLAGYARLVRPGGRLVLDLANIDAVRIQPGASSWVKDGVAVSSRYEFDETTKRAHTHRLATFADGRTERYDSSVRLFEEAEIEALLAETGWRCEERIGSYEGGLVSPENPRRILVCGRV